jgi:SpoIID/LytB domain protein
MSFTTNRRARFAAGVMAGSLLLVMVPTQAPAAAAAPEPSITFEGSGWGHGVGMSQYGAYARAIAGQSHEQILTAYYTGATIGTLGQGGLPAINEIVTNVASDITSTTLTVFDGPATPRTGMVVTRGAGEPSPQTATLNTGDTVTVVDTTPLAGNPHGCSMTLVIGGTPTDWGVGSCDLTVQLTTGGAAPTNLVRATNCRRPTQCTYGYGTSFQLVDNGSIQRTVGSTTYFDKIGGSGCQACPTYPGFDLVVTTTPDEYTRGIAEVPYSWGINAAAALRTQAVAARSYAASFAASTNHRTMGCFCDVRNDASYQVYAGWVGGWPEFQRWDKAATDTNGQVMAHPGAPDGPGIVRAYYSSSNGGASEWVKEKWGGNLPYLTSVDDPWSLMSPNPFRSWTSKFTADTVVDKIWGATTGYMLTGATVTARNTSGSAKTIRFQAVTPANQLVTKDVAVGTVASKFNLYSWYFDIDVDGLTVAIPNGADTAAVQDPTTGIWTLRGPTGAVTSFYFGNPRDIPFIGDWNGNGTQTVGLYRESTGYLFLRNSNTQGVADIEIYYGDPGDLPVAGDWNGDGTDTVGIYRRSDNAFYLRNSNTQGIADIVIPFGDVGDVPIAGDWNGDGKDTIGVFRPSTKVVYLVNDLANPNPDIVFTYEGAASGDKIVVGDWDANGVDTVGVFRPSTAMWYLRDTFTQSSANVVFEFGAGYMNPVAGYWGN